MHVGLGHAAARGVGGKATVGPLEGAAIGELGAFAALAEAVALEGERNEGTEGVVDLGHLDVFRTEVGVAPQHLAARPRRSHERIVAVVVGHHLVLRIDALPEGVNEGRGLAQVLRSLGRRDDARHRAVGLQAVVEQTEGLGDPASRHVVVACHRLGVHLRRRVAVGVLAEGDGHVRQVLARGAVGVHVPASEHGDLVDGANEAPGPRPLAKALHALCGLGPRSARAGAALSGPPGDRHLALTRGHGHGRVADDAAPGPPAEADLAEPRDVAGPEIAGYVGLHVGLHGIGAHAIDVGRCQTGVVQRRLDRLAGQRQLAPGQRLPIRGLPDPDDRRLVLDRHHPLNSGGRRSTKDSIPSLESSVPLTSSWA